MLNLTLNKFRDIGDYKRNIDDHKYVQKPINKVNTTCITTCGNRNREIYSQIVRRE